MVNVVDVGFSDSFTSDVELSYVSVEGPVRDALTVKEEVVVDVVPSVEDFECNDVEVLLISPNAEAVDDIGVVDGMLVSFSKACSDVLEAGSEDEDVVEEIETTSCTTGFSMFAMVTTNDSLPKLVSMLVATALCRLPMFDACNFCPTSAPVTSIVSGASSPTTMA